MERLVDTTISARSFDPHAGVHPIPRRAGTVIIGAGIVGASTAYHLAAAGETDVVLLDRSTVGSGSTWHAAGLVSSARSTPTLSELARYSIEEYQTLEERSGVDINFAQCGTLMLARTPERMDELRYTAAAARHVGVPAQVVAPSEVLEHWPLASDVRLEGGLFQPQDGYLNPGYAAIAYAKMAHERGATIREELAVTELLHANGRITGVRTAEGDIECDRVILTAGLWTRDLGRKAGVSLPLYAAEHVHVRTAEVDGAHSSLPVLRDMDGHFYIRHEAGRFLVGAFEPRGIPRSVEEVDAASRGGAFAQFPPAWDHFSPVRTHAEERVPVLKNTAFERFLNAPESFTPDTNFLLGQTAQLQGLFVGAGFNSQGIIYGPGAGRALAQWAQTGVPDFDAAPVDVQRFSAQQSNRAYLHERTRESLGRLYAMHWPHLQPVTARGVRRSPLHERLKEANAGFGETAGWERPNWYALSGESTEYRYSYQRQNWFEASGAEHRAARETAAIFDLSSFTKIEVCGPDALAVLQRFCTANADLGVRRGRYTLMLNEGGGIELDGTVVRLAEDRFWVITPASSQVKTLERLRGLTRGRAAAVFDATSGFATIALMGPNSREILRRISPEDWSHEAQKFGALRQVEIADGWAESLRISFVGEIGYELYPTADTAVNLYDAIIDAGRDLGLRRAGYHALDSLRLEKGFRHLGHDIGPADDPFEAGLGFTLSFAKETPFIGREALEPRRESRPRRRAVHVALRDPDPLLLHHESIVKDGRIVGRVTSGAYGHTLGRAVGMAYLDGDLEWDDAGPVGEFTVDCAGVLVPADLSARPFFDPDHTRMKG